MTAPSTTRAALDRLERANRRVIIAIMAAAAIEFLLLTAVLIVIDFGDALQRLVLLLAMLTYFTLGLGLVAVAAHVSRVGERVLNALELLRD